MLWVLPLQLPVSASVVPPQDVLGESPKEAISSLAYLPDSILRDKGQHLYICRSKPKATTWSNVRLPAASSSTLFPLFKHSAHIDINYIKTAIWSFLCPFLPNDKIPLFIIHAFTMPVFVHDRPLLKMLLRTIIFCLFCIIY